MSDKIDEYDGFIIMPENLEESKMVFFNLSDESSKGTPIETTKLGEKYHVVYFRLNKEQNDVEFDDTFEAIFIDPVYYAKQLLPSFYCMIVRKTDKSIKWFEEYLQELLQRVIISKLKKHKEILESIANN